MSRVAVIGTGYVGLTTGACFAHLGHQVVCADLIPEKIDRLSRGDVPILEAGLDELVREGLATKRLSFVLGEEPAKPFISALKDRGVEPLSIGRSIVATTTPHEQAVVEVIRNLGLEMHVVFNKGSVMILPPGVNKETGLRAALLDLELSPHNVIAVGDAENDHALLRGCGLGKLVDFCLSHDL